MTKEEIQKQITDSKEVIENYGVLHVNDSKKLIAIIEELIKK